MFHMTTSTTSTASVRGELVRSNICIVGNGAIAKTAALGLSQAGHSVTLLVPPARLEDGDVAQHATALRVGARVLALLLQSVV